MQLIKLYSLILVFIVPNIGATSQKPGFYDRVGGMTDISERNPVSHPRGISLTVNSHVDENQRDDRLTLREAIAIVNGSLAISDLTVAEASNISPPKKLGAIRIEFDLPTGQNTIELRQPLPPITSPGLTIDGLTLERGFVEPKQPPTTNHQPLVKITRAADAIILRGLSIMADDVTIRGLHLYGFSPETAPGSTPSAEIFISGHLPEQFIGDEPPDLATIDWPQNISIEDNWLGEADTASSTFGIWIFNGENITIERNQIVGHQGSGIISSFQAVNLHAAHNLIADNGRSGMPDGIRLEGNVTGTIVANNQISGNGGAGIFLFKPIGAVQIQSNQIESNGWRGSHPAIYLMGRGHEAIDNQIIGQNGAGVVVSANPMSDRNRIQGNQFADLQGLSIDLNSDRGRSSIAPYYGDGPNPPRNSSKQRSDIGNYGIDAPQFLASEFAIVNGRVNIDGIAEPDSVVEIYRVLAPGRAVSSLLNAEAFTTNPGDRGPLTEPITTVQSDRTGRFSLDLTNLEPGTIISATATHPDYGTSEPARNAIVAR